jgi:hypothetical protein
LHTCVCVCVREGGREGGREMSVRHVTSRCHQDLTMLDADELEDKDAENKGARDLI